MADLLRVSILGDMPGGEEWSINPVFSVGGDFGTPVSSTQANTIALALAALAIPTGLTNLMSPTTSVKGYRVEARSAAGVLESQGEALRAAPQTGASPGSKPFQTCAVFSLRTALAGASGRGRLYWPATGALINTTTLRPTAADVTSWLTAMKSYMTGITNAIDVTLDGVALSVWSRKLANTTTVNAIQLGDVLDVQRRRRDQLVETYQSAVFP